LITKNDLSQTRPFRKCKKTALPVQERTVVSIEEMQLLGQRAEAHGLAALEAVDAGQLGDDRFLPASLAIGTPTRLPPCTSTVVVDPCR
jgi:hypothetical protein